MTQALPANKLVARGIENQELILIAEHAESVKKTSKIHGCHGFDPVRHGRDGTPLPSVSGAQRTARPTFNLRESANGAGGASDIEGAKGSGERAGK